VIYQKFKQWSSRLNIDTMKQVSKQLAKMASGNALPIFALLINRAKNYENMHEAQLQALA